MKYLSTDNNINTNINKWFNFDGVVWGISYDKSSANDCREPILIDEDGIPVDLPDQTELNMLEEMKDYQV